MHTPISKVYRIIDSLSGRRKPRALYAFLALSRGTNIANIGEEFADRVFELLVYYCSTFMEMIPLSFMLGFYVTFTATRWWNQYMAIPWPDRLMNVLMMYVPGQDDGSRMLRRTLMRYLNLSLILVLRSISKAVKRRFPTKDHLIEAGFMTKLEVELWQSIPSTEFNTFWVPCTWFINLLREARNECRITDAQGVKLILEEFNDFRAKCGLLWSYDWISIPLVYTQVVTMATYSFFAAAVFGRQYIHSPDPIIDSRHHFDFYVPVFTVIQYFLYMGLLKVAEQLINPFGDDDEDFELNWIIDRHFKVSYLGVDTLDGPPPPLVKDSYFYKMDYQLPYTAASVSYKKKTYRGSVAYMHVPQKERGMVVPEMSEEDDEDSPRDGGSGGEDDDGRHGLSKRSSSSLWTLMHRRSTSPPNDNVESGLAQDSKLHVYFKGSSPSGSQEDSEDANGLSDGSQQKHLLQAHEERRSDRQGPEPSPLHGQRSFLRELFSSKPAMRVQAWTGADGDYASPAKRPRKHHHRTKVSFCAETSGRPRFDKSSLRLKSRSTSDLAADMAAALKPALLLTSALGSSTVPGHRRKSLGGDRHLETTVPETVTHSHSLPELLVPDTMPPAPLEPGPPDKPVCTTVPPTTTSAEPATVIAPTRRRSSQLDASVDPMTPVHIPVTSPQSALVKDSLKPPSILGQARHRERRRTTTALGAMTKPDGTTEDVALAVPLRKAAILTAATATAAAAPGLPPPADPEHPKLPDIQPPTTLRRKPRLRVRVSVPEESDVSDGSGSKPAPETSEAPLLPPGSAPEPAPDVSPSTPPPVDPPDKGKRTRSLPKETTEKTEGAHSRVRKMSGEDKDTLGFHKDKHKADDSDDNKSKITKEPEKKTTTKDPSQTGKEPKSETSDKVESDEGKDDVEFVVFIQEKAPDRPKQLIIVPGPPQRAGSVDSLLGDSRPSRAKRRASLDSGVQADDDPAHASERKERTTQVRGRSHPSYGQRRRIT
ncbi:bestrophin-3 [Ixodes scapularis]